LPNAIRWRYIIFFFSGRSIASSRKKKSLVI
jgi:hypothetical protein